MTAAISPGHTTIVAGQLGTAYAGRAGQVSQEAGGSPEGPQQTQPHPHHPSGGTGFGHQPGQVHFQDRFLAVGMLVLISDQAVGQDRFDDAAGEHVNGLPIAVLQAAFHLAVVGLQGRSKRLRCDEIEQVAGIGGLGGHGWPFGCGMDALEDSKDTAADKWFAPAPDTLAFRQKLATDFPKVPEYQSDVGATLDTIARALKGIGRLTDARQTATEAIRFQQIAIKINARSPTYRLDSVLHELKRLRREKGSGIRDAPC